VIRQILMCPDDDASAIKNFMLKNDRPYALVSRSITRGNRKFPVAMFTRAYARQRRVCERINLSEREIIQKGKHRFEHYLTQGKTEEPARTLFLVKAPSLKTRWKEKEMKRYIRRCQQGQKCAWPIVVPLPGHARRTGPINDYHRKCSAKSSRGDWRREQQPSMKTTNERPVLTRV